MTEFQKTPSTPKSKRIQAEKGKNISDALKDDLVFASELISRGIANLQDINQCLKEKYESQEAISLGQLLLRKKCLSIEQFVTLKKEIESSPQDQVIKRLQEDSKIMLKEDSGRPFLELKADFNKLGRYRILRELGRGGMGVVYAARDEDLEKTVAIKTLRPGGDDDQVEVERFEREARLAASLSHPGIVAVHEVGIHNAFHYFVMDYVDGLPLSSYIEKAKPNLNAMLNLLKEVAEALAYAHSRNIVHRDIKPANILVDTEGKPHLTDFGLARNIKEGKQLTVSGVALGTPSYMPPEQASGRIRNITKASDVYALGAVLYHLITGRPPFAGASLAQTIAAVLEQEPIPPRKLVKGLPREVEIICLKCLEKDPKRRYPNAKAFSMDLERFLKGEVIHASPANFIYKSTKWVHRNRAISLSVLFLLLGFLSFAYLFYFAPGFLTIIPKSRISGQFVPIPAQFTLDGKEVGTSHLKRLKVSSGYHRVSISSPGYHSLEFLVHLSPREEIALEKELVPQKGRVTISSSLSGIEARFVNPKSKEVQTLVAPVYEYEMDEGEYDVVFSKRNYFSKKAKAKIRYNQTSSLNVQLKSMLLWRREVSDRPDINSIHIAELNGDGEPELICTRLTGAISAFSLKKEEKKWEYFQQLPRHAYRLALRDVNKDGIADIVSSHTDRFLILDGKSREEIFSLPSWWGIGFIFTDADEDGYDDVVLISDYKGMGCYKFKQEKGKTAKSLWSHPPVLNSSYCKPVFIAPFQLAHAKDHRLCVTDVRTGKTSGGGSDMSYSPGLEYALVNGNSVLIWHVTSKQVTCMDIRTQRTLWSFPTPVMPSKGVLLYDIDQDGEKEVLLHLDKMYCLDIRTGKLRWSFDSENKVKGSLPCVGDLDGDGKVEIVLGTQAGALYVLDGQTGTPIGKFLLQNAIGEPVLCDVDGDGNLEILFPSARHVYCIRHVPDEGIEIFDEDPLLDPQTTTVSDLNGDGKKEILVGSKSGKLYCFDGETGQIAWQYMAKREITHETGVCDLDRDGKPELVVQSRQIVTTLTHDGKLIWERTLSDVAEKGRPVFVDVDADGFPEIIIKFFSGEIYCLHGKTGAVRWQNKTERIYATPAVVGKKGAPDILTFGGRKNVLYCFEGRDGRMKWNLSLPYYCVEASEVAIHDLDSDGYPEIFVPQIVGYVTCLDGKNGSVRWSKRIRGAAILAPPLIGDFDGDQKQELVVTSVDEDLHCLDAETGKLKWRWFIPNNWASSNETSLAKVDIDGDGLPDIVSTSSFGSFNFVSGKDGRWLGSIDKFGIIVSPLRIIDLDGDGLLDLVCIDTDSSLIRIYDVMPYFKKSLRALKNANADLPTMIVARFNRLLEQKAYDRMRLDILKYEEELKDWPHLLHFYKGVVLLSSRETGSALAEFEKSNAVPGNIYDNRFLEAIACFAQGNDSRAHEIIVQLATLSVKELDRCHERYGSLAPEGIRILPRLRKIVHESGIALRLDKGYQFAVESDRKKEGEEMLSLSLKYSLPNAPHYEQRSEAYLQKVMRLIEQRMNIYHMHEIIDILDHALEILPESALLIGLRGKMYVETHLSEEKGMEEMERSLAIDPKQPEILLLLGQLYHNRKKYSEALAAFQKCAKQSPKMAQAHLARMTTYIYLDKKEIALKTGRWISENCPPSPNTPQFYIFEILQSLAQDQEKKGRELFSKMAGPLQRFDPWIVQALFMLFSREK